MCRGLGLLAALVLLIAPSTALADNDNWQSADSVFFQATESASNAAYTTQLGELVAPTTSPACPRMGKTAWWRIVGTGQPITLSTAVGATNFNTVLAVMTGNPDSGSRIGCDDDRAAGDALHRSELPFSSVRGTPYLVQVGGFDPCDPPLTACPDFGNIVLRASSVRPLNDDRAAPAALVTAVPATTSNVGASQERGEDTACGTSQFAATVWYRWTAPGTGDAIFRSSASFANVVTNQSDTVLAVYRVDTGARVGCADDAGQAFGPSAVSARVTGGDYLLQIGAHGAEGSTPIGEGSVEGKVDFAADADNDGASTLTDCNDADAGSHPGATDVAGNGVDEDCDGQDAQLDPVQLAKATDKDGDGFPAGVDCRDDSPAINPGAADKPGDGVDQDCKQGDAPFPRLGAGVAVSWKNFPSFTRFTVLAVKRSPAGVKVKLTCKGGGCPFRSKQRTIRKATTQFNLVSLLRRAKLRRGARLELRVTRAGHVGGVTTWTIRAPADPKRSDRCLVPGKTSQSRC
jgi:hypothetical protein